MTWPTRRRDLVAFYVAAFFLIFLVYRLSPVSQIYDSRYSVLLSQNLVRRHTFDLTSALPADLRGPAATLPYQFHREEGHIYYTYPPGTPLLTTPLVALGPSVTDGAGNYLPKVEKHIQSTLAALLAAGAVGLLLVIGRRFLALPQAVAVAALLAFGTPLWSTASRALWSQTTEVLLLAAALLLLIARRTPLRSLLLGTLLGWLYITRPIAALSIAAILFYLLFQDRRRLLLVAPTALVWFVGFCAWSMSLYHSWRPPYYATGLSAENFFGAAAGQLFSPARGLLIFCPWLLALIPLLVRLWKSRAHRPLLLTGLGVIVAHWLVISAWPMWWFGHCFGPRAFLDVVPWMGVVTILAVSAAPLRPSGAAVMLTTLLIAVSVLIHGEGAMANRAQEWNNQPQNIDAYPERAWDWRDPQFLAGFLARPQGR